MLEAELAARKKAGEYAASFKYVCHFLGYQGRCGLPSPFDAQYCYALVRPVSWFFTCLFKSVSEVCVLKVT